MRGNHFAVQYNAQEPIGCHEADADAIANEHCNDATRISGRLASAEGLRSDKISYGISDVENRELHILLGVASGISLSEGDAHDVWTEVGITLCVLEGQFLGVISATYQVKSD